MTARGPGERRALRVYRALLILFPRRFLRARGEGMESLFLDMWRARVRDGGGGALSFWTRLTWDTVVHAAREWAAPGPGRSSHSRIPLLVSSTLADTRLAARALVRQPLYAGMVVLIMTVGIAGNAAVFRVFNGLFLRPLAFEDAAELVDLDTSAESWNLEYTGVAYADFAAWREGNRTFRGMGAFAVRGANLLAEDDAERVDVIRATWDLAPVLRLEPVLGRGFDEAEDVPGGPDVALLTNDFWESRFGADPDVAGRTILLDDVPYEVLGVLPDGADRVAEADLWVPLREDPDRHSSFYLSAVGRLGPGVDVVTAEADLTAIHDAQAERWSVNEHTSPVVASLRDRYLGELRLGSSVLLGAVGIVLLIACADIAGLMLARSLGRRREMAVRIAMGAGRGRIVRQLLVEGLVLAGLGAAVGSLVGIRGSDLMASALESEFPPWVTFDLDLSFLLFTVGVTVAAAVLFGLAPALHGARTEPADTLKGASGRMTGSAGSRRVMSALVVGEVALAFALLVVAGVSMKDLRALNAVDPGFRTDGVLTWVVQLPDGRYPDGDASLAFWTEHLERLRAIPGVTDAVGSTVLPLSGHSGWFFEVEDAAPRGEDDPNPVVLVRAVTPGYLEAMEVELIAGRGFTDFDGREDGSKAAVVNESFVREFLAHRADPLGARIRTGGDDEPWWTVVGVNRDTRHYGPGEEMRPGVHQPLRQLPIGALDLAVLTDGDPGGLAEPVRRVLVEHDPGLAMFAVSTMREMVDEALWPRRAASWLIVAFSTTALLLAVSGIYGVISYTVRQRVHEVGIRMALGARRSDVALAVLGHGLRMVVGGTVLGMGLSVLLAPLLSGALFRASPNDPVVYVAVTGVVLGVALLANLLPARRAARLDPMGVLRGE